MQHWRARLPPNARHAFAAAAEGEWMNMIDTYFNAERTTGLLFTIAGVLAIGVAIWGWRQGVFWRGAAWPLMIVALIQIGVGASIWLRSPGDLQRVQYIAVHQHAQILEEEIPRMQGVIRDFSTSRWIEIAVFVAGLLLIVLLPKGGLWQGIGSGLVVQVALILLLDSLAAQRGRIYLEWLHATFY